MPPSSGFSCPSAQGMRGYHFRINSREMAFHFAVNESVASAVSNT